MNIENAADDATNKREQVLERLNKRNKDRQNHLDVKVEQRNKEILELEGADYFAQTFAERVNDIEMRLQNISDTAAKKATASGDRNNSDLIRLFTDITSSIQELQRYLTASTMFLPDFKIKACQKILNDLTSNCDATRTRILPKKKFGFSGKKVAPKVLINPKLNLNVNNIDKIDAATEKIADTTEADGRSAQTFIWTLSNRQREYICLMGDEVNGQDITISNMHKCFIELQGYAGSVQLSNITDCTILCGPIARSLFAENCQNVTLAAACQQSRVHSSKSCKIYLHVTCRGIIEDCKDIEIAAYNYTYTAIDADFRNAGLDKTQNNYMDIADFNWLSPDVRSPNWRLMNNSDVQQNWMDLRMEFEYRLDNAGGDNDKL